MKCKKCGVEMLKRDSVDCESECGACEQFYECPDCGDVDSVIVY